MNYLESFVKEPLPLIMVDAGPMPPHRAGWGNSGYVKFNTRTPKYMTASVGAHETMHAIGFRKHDQSGRKFTIFGEQSTPEYFWEYAFGPIDVAKIIVQKGLKAGVAEGDTIWKVTGTDKGKVIIDKGGSDIIDISEQTNGSVLDLRVINSAKDDYFSYFIESGKLMFSIPAGVQIENATGGSGSDRIFGNWLNNRLLGGDGDDTMFGSDGHDTINGGTGSDFLDGGNGRNIVFGDDGNDRIFGGGWSDDLSGGNGRDVLRAGGGDDTLSGGLDSDTLTGGDGNDLLDGGSGLDRYVFGRGFGRDIITGFEIGADKIDLRGFGLSFDDLVIRAGSPHSNGIPSRYDIGIEGVGSIHIGETISGNRGHLLVLGARDFYF